ncbi:MAG: DnaJ domain-containing protein, partial [Gallionella sp.]
MPPHRRHELENLYNILGVSPTATTDEIKKAYRSLAMR